MSQSSHVNRTAEAIDSTNLFKKPTKSISIGEAIFTRYWALAMLVFVLCTLAAIPAFATTNRVTDGQQVLYTFNEGSGSTVRDVSGVGTLLDLTIQDTNATRWLSGGGLAIDSPTLITSTGAASKLINAIKASHAITIEAWIKPANTNQTGPARIVSLSNGPSTRNFTLGQSESHYDARLRTTDTTNNGIPSLSTPAGTAFTGLTHVVYTRDAKGNVQLYVNDVQQSAGTLQGDTSNWATDYLLALANETTNDRPWLGELHLVAIYSRALNSTEVAQNFKAGPKPATPLPDRVTDGQQVLYTFNEGSGSTVRDVSGVGTLLDLTIQDTNATRWLSGGGLAIDSPTLITSTGAASKLINAIKASHAITIEAWIKPANTNQTGPARIVSLSNGPSTRNFTLGQSESHYDARLRTTDTTNNGIPSLSTPAGTAFTGLTHVVYTRDAKGNVQLYVNDVQQSAGTLQGDTSNWATDYLLALANETTNDRPWLGELHLVAIYSRALNSTEVAQNFKAGPKPATPLPDRVTDGQQVLYTFNEGSGSTVRDVSGVGTLLDLTIQDTNATRWLSGGGLAIDSPTLITSTGAASKLINAIKASHAITIEAWIKPANINQTGPARIVSLSNGPSTRNFTLGQSESHYDARLRTTDTTNNGIPSLSTPAGTAFTGLTHVVYTRDAKGNVQLYVNDVQQSAGTLQGDTSNWATDYLLALANETTNDRPWLGELHLVAIYSRALNSTEVAQNFEAGPKWTSNSDNTDSGDSSTTTVATDQDTSVDINVLGDGQESATVSIISEPSYGTASVQPDNTIRYTPNSGYTGQDSITYKITDAYGNITIANVTVNVVTCTSCADMTLTLTWDPNPDDVLGYRVYYGTTPSTATQEISDLYITSGDVNESAPSVTYKASSLGAQAGDTMCFAVKAHNLVGESDFSTAVCEKI